MNVYVHNIDPFALQFTETFGIRWYGLAYLAGFVLAGLTMYFMVKRKATPLALENIADLVTYGAFGVMLGGRLGYAMFYSPELLIDFSSQFPYWGVLAVHKGGMASHGGMMGVMVACWFFARKHKLKMFHLLDMTMLAGALAFFFGRIANFVNGELYGRMADDGYRWAVKFPQELYRWASETPAKLNSLASVVEELSPFRLGSEMVKISQSDWISWVTRWGADKQNKVYAVIEQLIARTQMNDAQTIEVLGAALTSRYPSQLIQALMEGLLVFVILAAIWYKPRKPGVISCWFGILYALARIAGEQFRMPDSGIGFQALGLTRGQWLSVALLVVSAAVLVIIAKRPAEKLGGWGKGSV